MASSRNTLLVAVLAAALGYGAARAMAPASRDGELLRELHHQAVQGDRLAAQLAEMQMQLRALLATQGAVLSPPASPPVPVVAATGVPGGELPAPVTSPPPATPESVEALGQAHTLIDRAAASHRWGSTEVAELRRLLGGLNGPQHLKVLQALSAALNRGDIRGTLSGVFVE